MKRRPLLAGAATLAVAGAGAAWWTWGRTDPAEQALAEFLAGQGTDPAGQAMPLGRWRGQALVLNFWATWCPPCVRELPELDRFARLAAPRGWQVLGVAIDRPQAVREFLAHTPVGFPIAVTGYDSLPLLTRLGNAGGGLPFSLVVGPDGHIRQRKLGATTLAELQRWTA